MKWSNSSSSIDMAVLKGISDLESQQFWNARERNAFFLLRTCPRFVHILILYCSGKPTMESFWRWTGTLWMILSFPVARTVNIRFVFWWILCSSTLLEYSWIIIYFFNWMWEMTQVICFHLWSMYINNISDNYNYGKLVEIWKIRYQL